MAERTQEHLPPQWLISSVLHSQACYHDSVAASSESGVCSLSTLQDISWWVPSPVRTTTRYSTLGFPQASGRHYGAGVQSIDETAARGYNWNSLSLAMPRWRLPFIRFLFIFVW